MHFNHWLDSASFLTCAWPRLLSAYEVNCWSWDCHLWPFCGGTTASFSCIVYTWFLFLVWLGTSFWLIQCKWEWIQCVASCPTFFLVAWLQIVCRFRFCYLHWTKVAVLQCNNLWGKMEPRLQCCSATTSEVKWNQGCSGTAQSLREIQWFKFTVPEACSASLFIKLKNVESNPILLQLNCHREFCSVYIF